MVLTLFLCPILYAQNTIQGTIANWSNGEVPLVFNDYISKEKTTMGSIAANGKLVIPLDENFLSYLQAAALKAKEKAPKGWEMKFNTVESMFGCSDQGVIYTNANSILSGLPDLEALSKDEAISYGYLYCTNNAKLSAWLYNYGQGNSAKGYYLRWFFAENNASAKGSCNMPTYTGNDDENYIDSTIYDVELTKGWNIIKYEIVETFTGKSKKVVPSKTKITRVDKIPADAKWLLLSE